MEKVKKEYKKNGDLLALKILSSLISHLGVIAQNDASQLEYTAQCFTEYLVGNEESEEQERLKRKLNKFLKLEALESSSTPSKAPEAKASALSNSDRGLPQTSSNILSTMQSDFNKNILASEFEVSVLS